MDGHSSNELPQITVDSEQTCNIHGNVSSRSLEDLLTIDNHSDITTLGQLASAHHRHCSMPEALDTVGTTKPGDDHESVNQIEDEQGFLSAMELRSANQKREQQTLTLPVSASASRKEMHYDYVRRSIFHQSLRISNLKRSTKDSGDDCKATSMDGFDSDEGGYVIQCLNEEELPPIQTQEPESTTSSSYVQLLSSTGPTADQASERHTSQSSDEADSNEQYSPPCSPRPPLFLHEHPSVTGEAADSTDNEGDYEEIIIYEELGTSLPEGEHDYDSIQQMRERVTRLVHGKHRRKLKKFIVKRKSNEQLVTSDLGSHNQHSICEAAEESDNDSSEEDDLDIKPISRAQQVRFEPIDRRQPDPNKLVLRRSHTCRDEHWTQRSQRDTRGNDNILRKSQYDQMMEVMLSDREVKELQDAGAVKIKNITELRAEIEQLVKNAPSVPPPLPDHNRPKMYGKSQKKWSSKSLRY